MTDLEREMDKRDEFVVVKSWHTLIIVLSLLITGVLAYASLRDQVTEDHRRVTDMEQNRLTKELYDAGQKETERRLANIEQKLDQRETRDFKRDIEEGNSTTGYSKRK